MFTPYNPNPRGINTGDCVIRAICKATNKTWEKVYAELTIKGLQEAMWGDTNTVWEKYLKENGFVKEVIPNTCPECYTIADFSNETKPYLYEKTMGYSQLDQPIFRKARLVFEDDTPQAQESAPAPVPATPPEPTPVYAELAQLEALKASVSEELQNLRNMIDSIKNPQNNNKNNLEVTLWQRENIFSMKRRNESVKTVRNYSNDTNALLTGV